uniref:adenosylmethionine decarboxylase n=1 Tax=Octactis speculum TaxID=3111310 RepID=A0A7S2HLL7_9STRA|mmetsp:Transcript_7567/g.9412  ORF Transcript_7567/g.9412 Transcript_7567/m.9412 type:complete len:372 (+) Transcript_7567:226-1341(+)
MSLNFQNDENHGCYNFPNMADELHVTRITDFVLSRVHSENSLNSSLESNESIECNDVSSDGSESYTGSFEGPEKNLEICFKTSVGNPEGCRALPRDALNAICTAAQCTIISCISNADHALDAYVLSESSLFVFTHRMIIKTCGRTSLLRCLEITIQLALELCGLELEWVGYSRKNFTFPEEQVYPHSSFQEEFTYVSNCPSLHALGPTNSWVSGPDAGEEDKWILFNVGKWPTCSPTVRINLMMFDMSPDVANSFYMMNCEDGKKMTHMTGIDKLVPGYEIDDRAFDPCGYSMNAIGTNDGAYATIHVTPEPECSYASFETNAIMTSYSDMMKNVLGVFQPKRFFLTIMGDKEGLLQVNKCNDVYDDLYLC